MEFCGTYRQSGQCRFSTEARLFNSRFDNRGLVSLECKQAPFVV